MAIPPTKPETDSQSSTCSLLSFETDSSVEVEYQRSRPPPPPPPPPLIRKLKPKDDSVLNTRITFNSLTDEVSVPPPPPLPLRRATVMEEVLPPKLPARPFKTSESAASITNKTNGGGVGGPERLPPPPTRTIALGEKLPRARRASTPMSSDEEDDAEEDEDPRLKVIEKLPDSSSTSRLPPKLPNLLFTTRNIQVPAHSGRILASGSRIIVSRSQQISGYDLNIGEQPIWNLDKRDLRLKDNKITSMEFRPAQLEHERGIFLWLGSKEGHIIEIDSRTGAVKQSKSAAHSHTISYIFRHARSMITVDTTSGKCNVFSPLADEDVSLMHTQPTVKRLPERQDWIGMLSGLLWCATRPDGSAAIGGTHRPPAIRIYDPFGSSSASRVLVVPTADNLGAVTSGTVMLTQPGKVFLGHEGGSVSIWDTSDSFGAIKCIEIMKVSASDILCLAAIHDRLWTGGRKGYISAYDVVPKPWCVTNAWEAHGGTPVTSLAADPFSIDKIHRLSVISVGRDESAQLWDGLFSQDWMRAFIFQECNL